ncbi:uncharacterized protein BYT42DRAFT_578245 [Radiomyces spectabilis]|uniref:uncharacterized protein n=1 Tax=Radiomyces spectabilis TaxID=64574 RepID=UPI0022211382|nr:uncharacterized protein BYT42DRAFT_578245 [Radiomyces spectabilis]KAI8372856.1 hypothetical protein BYT42DRAFT_578245 [Radiomyces spectabilis]
MRRLWHSVNTVSNTAKCILCRNLETQDGRLTRIDTWRPILLIPLKFSHSSAALAINDDPTDGREKRRKPVLLDCLNDDLMHPRSVPVNLESRKSKAALLSEFYRVMATQDIERIWPLYSHLFHNNYHLHLSQRTYRHLFLYTIRARATRKNVHRLNALVEDMKMRRFPLQADQYNALIHWVGGRDVPVKRPHHLTQALALLDEMVACNIEPDVITYNTLIHIASHLSDIRTAQRLYHDMIARGLRPDKYTYSTLISGMGRMGDRDGIETMVAHLRDTQTSEISNDTVVWNAIMTSYAQVGTYEKALYMFDAMQKTLSSSNSNSKDTVTKAPSPDADSFRIYIDIMLNHRRLDKALEALRQMDELRITPIVTTYNAFFAYFMRPSAIDGDSDVNDDHSHHAAVSNTDIVKQLYDAMQQKKVMPNSETLYTLVSALLDLGDTQSALETYLRISDNTAKRRKKTPLTSSIAVLAKERLTLSRSRPTKTEPNQELLDRLNHILQTTVK